jgi:hypothetical protein
MNGSKPNPRLHKWRPIAQTRQRFALDQNPCRADGSGGISFFIEMPDVSTRATLFPRTQDRCVWRFDLRDELRSAAATLLGEQSAGLRAMFVMKVPDKFFV